MSKLFFRHSSRFWRLDNDLVMSVSMLEVEVLGVFENLIERFVARERACWVGLCGCPTCDSRGRLQVIAIRLLSLLLTIKSLRHFVDSDIAGGPT